jgi:toxin YoeB
MPFDLKFVNNAWEEYQEAEKKDSEKINKLIKGVRRDNPPQMPEPLKYEYSGWFSLEINKKDRLIYRIIENTVEVLSCQGHYDDR